MGDAALQKAWELAMGPHRAGRWSDAEVEYRRLITGDIGNGTYHANLGVVLANQRRFAEARESLGAALRIGASAEIYNLLGNVLKDQGDPAGAAGAFRQALVLRPGYAEAHFNLGSAMHKLGALEEAVSRGG